MKELNLFNPGMEVVVSCKDSVSAHYWGVHGIIYQLRPYKRGGFALTEQCRRNEYADTYQYFVKFCGDLYEERRAQRPANTVNGLWLYEDWIAKVTKPTTINTPKTMKTTDLNKTEEEIVKIIREERDKERHEIYSAALVQVSGIMSWLTTNPPYSHEDLLKYVLAEFKKAATGNCLPESPIIQVIEHYEGILKAKRGQG